MAVLFEQNTELQQEIKILTRALVMKQGDEVKHTNEKNDTLK